MAFCTSLSYAAELLMVTASCVSQACHGYKGTMKTKNHYVRFGGLEDIEDAKKGLLNMTVFTG